MMTQLDRAADEKTEELLEELVRLCVDEGGPCFKDWPTGLVRQYLVVQAAAGNLVFVRTFGRIAGIGIAWQTNELDVRDAVKKGNHAWDHGPNRTDGDTVFFSEFVATRRGVLQQLLQEIWVRRREWRRLKWFTIRDGEVVRLNGTRYEMRFLTKGY